MRLLHTRIEQNHILMVRIIDKIRRGNNAKCQHIGYHCYLRTVRPLLAAPISQKQKNSLDRLWSKLAGDWGILQLLRGVSAAYAA